MVPPRPASLDSMGLQEEDQAARGDNAQSGDDGPSSSDGKGHMSGNIYSSAMSMFVFIKNSIKVCRAHVNFSMPVKG